MKIGNFYFNHLPRLEFHYHSIEFNPETIEKCTKKLNDLIKQNWNIESEHQTERGLVIELSRVIK